MFIVVGFLAFLAGFGELVWGVSVKKVLGGFVFLCLFQRRNCLANEII
jgi:hypothetical protein